MKNSTYESIFFKNKINKMCQERVSQVKMSKKKYIEKNLCMICEIRSFTKWKMMNGDGMEFMNIFFAIHVDADDDNNDYDGALELLPSAVHVKHTLEGEKSIFLAFFWSATKEGKKFTWKTEHFVLSRCSWPNKIGKTTLNFQIFHHKFFISSF